ncbi:targeting protein for Xklp2 [Calliopsis andreniformis]|uniref:targeting protein for Xklp2 n=1 Tax=Calliopsis andreniformis TaxID=337506 RepID=UPI003FCD2DB6
MDSFCAPQWADFTQSPQIPADNYFEKEHEVHKPQIQIKFKSNLKSDQLFSSCKKETEQEISVAKANFYDSLEPDQTVHSTYFVPYDDQKQSIGEEHNDNNLHKDMTNLKLDEKLQEIHCTWNVSIGELATVSNKPKAITPEKTKESVHVLEMKDIAIKFSSKSNPLMNNVKEKKDHVQVKSLERRQPVKVYRIQSQLSEKRQSLRKPQSKVLTCQYRRRSLVKYRNCSNKFISIAEAVSRFQNTTPQRFRTLSNKDLKPGQLMKLKRSPLKLTNPISPALRCKQRVRHTTALSQQEREALEIEEMKKHQIKAKPVPANILKAPTVLKKVAKKPVTVTEEFHLTQPKKTSHSSLHGSSQNTINKKEHNQKRALSLACSASASNIPNKKEDKPSNNSQDNIVKCVKNRLPLNFESRNKEFLLKREEKIKTLQTQETNKIKAEFHAKPVPKFVKSSVNSIKKDNIDKRMVVSCPFSFAERDKYIAKKKEQLAKQIQEQDKKRHVFHAKPAPTFKPVIVRHPSKEKLRNKEQTVTNSKNLATKNTKCCNDQENKQPNIIQTATIPVDVKEKGIKDKLNKIGGCKGITNDKNEKIKPEQNLRKSMLKPKFEVNNDKKAKERSELEKLKRMKQEEESKRLEEEKNRLAKEKLKRAELRKLTEVKAKPMPVYKPMDIQKSTKPLTSPHTPARLRKSRTKNVS